jgi:hypothetical protein
MKVADVELATEEAVSSFKAKDDIQKRLFEVRPEASSGAPQSKSSPEQEYTRMVVGMAFAKHIKRNDCSQMELVAVVRACIHREPKKEENEFVERKCKELTSTERFGVRGNRAMNPFAPCRVPTGVRRGRRR